MANDVKKIGNVTVELSDSMVIRDCSGNVIFDTSECKFGYICDLGCESANIIRVQACYYLVHFYCYQVKNYEVDCMATSAQVTINNYAFSDKPRVMFKNLLVGESQSDNTPLAIPILKSELWSFINKLKEELGGTDLLDDKIDLFEQRDGICILSFYLSNCLLFSIGLKFDSKGFKIYNNVFFNSAYENVIPVLNSEGVTEKFVSHTDFLTDVFSLRRIRKYFSKGEFNFCPSNASAITRCVYDALRQNENKKM